MSICVDLMLVMLVAGARAVRRVSQKYVLTQNICDVEDGAEEVVSVATYVDVVFLCV